MAYLSFAVPCYNEAENLPELISKFVEVNSLYSSQFETKLLIIDDASTDHTESLVKSYSEKLNGKLTLHYVRHPSNRGLTGGINTAFQYFESQLEQEGPPLAYGLMDGNNSHSPHTIPKLLHNLLEGSDVVIASRFTPGSRMIGVGKFKKIAERGLELVFKSMRNLPGVRDYSCGFRLYSPKIVKKLSSRYQNTFVNEPSFASVVEILIKCHLERAVFSEVPFILRYDQKLGPSKMKMFRTIFGRLKLLLSLRA
jgi:dolichol-phosphate mannosyltransferase